MEAVVTSAACVAFVALRALRWMEAALKSAIGLDVKEANSVFTLVVDAAARTRSVQPVALYVHPSHLSDT